MKVTTDITRRDLIDINIFLWPKIRWNWILVGAIFVLAMLPVVSAARASSSDPHVVAIALGTAVALAVGIPTFAFLFCLAINLASASEKSGLGQHEYMVTPDGLQETTALNSEFSKWASFDQVFKSKKHIILKKHWAALHVFPARSFETRQHFEDFFDEVTKHINHRG